MKQVFMRLPGGNTYLVGFTEKFKQFVEQYITDEKLTNTAYFADGTIVSFREGKKIVFYQSNIKAGRTMPLLLSQMAV